MKLGLPTLSGRALASRTSRGIFEDAAWEERFETLIRLTSRTSLIIELTGTDLTERTIKNLVDKRLGEWGQTAIRPRGNGRCPTSSTFLPTKVERFDAAYLSALYFGRRGPGEFSEVESNLGRALDRLIEAFLRYRADLYPDATIEPRLNFESFCLLIKGIRANEIELRNCPDCGSRHPWHSGLAGHPVCPVCAVLDLRMGAAQREIEARIREHRSRGRTHSGARELVAH
jgi:hypothetical protein